MKIQHLVKGIQYLPNLVSTIVSHQWFSVSDHHIPMYGYDNPVTGHHIRQPSS